MQWVHPYPFYLFLTGILIMSLLIPLLSPPRTYGRNFLALLLFLGGLLLSLTALELFVSNAWMMLFLRNLQQIPLFFAPVILFALAREYSGYDSEKTMLYLIYLSLPPLYFTGLIFSDEWHGYFREAVQIERVWELSQIQVTQTTQGFILSVYPLVIGMFSGMIMLQNVFGATEDHRRQHLLFLFAYAIPIVNIILVPILPTALPGQMAFGFSLMALVLYILYYRYQLLSIWPVAKDRIFNAMKEGVLVFDRNWRLIEVNEAAKGILEAVTALGDDEELTEEKAANHWIKNDEVFMQAVQNRASYETEWKINGGDVKETVFLEARTFPIARSRSGDEATLIILNDITTKKRYEADLVNQATMDYLTRIPNRRHFMEQFREVMADTDERHSLMLIDLDHFKEVNDRFGHQTGDQVLRHFAILLEEFFKGCLVGRIGGEEFGVLLNDGCHETVKQAEAFQSHLKEHPFLTKTEEHLHLLVSIGVAEVTIDVQAVELGYRQADEAMYEAKRSGRNRTVCFGDHCK